MLVFMDGKEELVLPPTPYDGPEGTYVVNDLGKMELAGNDLSEDEDIEQIYPEEEVHGVLIRRNFHATPKSEKISQRENIFQTKCRVSNDLCDLIINSGSESNCMSKELVKRLNLTTQPHPRPYKLRWLD